MSRKSRMHRQSNAEQAVAEDDIEIVDEQTTEEENNPDPVDVLKREVEKYKNLEAEAEERAAKERQRREELERQTATYGETQLATDKELLEQHFAVADSKAGEAKRKYAAAASQGLWEDAAEAQRELVRLETAMMRYSERYQELDRPKPKPKADPVDAFDEQIAQIAEPDVRQWAIDHKADLMKPERQRLAFAANELAVARGLKPGSNEYLDFLDEQLGYEMTQEDEEAPPAPAPKAAPSRRSPSVAAPVTRGSAGQVKTVTLTQDDKRWASQLGMTEKDYAKLKAASAKDERFNRYAGRV